MMYILMTEYILVSWVNYIDNNANINIKITNTSFLKEKPTIRTEKISF